MNGPELLKVRAFEKAVFVRKSCETAQTSHRNLEVLLRRAELCNLAFFKELADGKMRQADQPIRGSDDKLAQYKSKSSSEMGSIAGSVSIELVSDKASSASVLRSRCCCRAWE